MDIEICSCCGKPKKPKVGNRKQTGAKFKLTHETIDNGGFNDPSRKSFDVNGPATDLASIWSGHRYGLQCLKPALEPIIVFQKPYEGSPVDNITSTGAGALWIDGGRIGTDEDTARNPAPNTGVVGADFGIRAAMGGTGSPLGRWPANLVLTHAPECNGVCIPSCPVARLGSQSGESFAGIATRRNVGVSPHGMYSPGTGVPEPDVGFGDSGTASRYFYAADWMLDRLEAADPVAYIAKASTAEREAGLDPRQTALMRLLDEDAADFEDSGRHHTAYGEFQGVPGHTPNSRTQFDPSTVDDGRDVSIDNPYQRGETTRRNIHPTIKPISLSRYLATLLLPPAAYGPRRLLIPFAGAGSEAIGAMLAGWEEITGVELEAEHVAIANARLAYWKQRTWELLDPGRKPTVTSAAAVPAGQLDMFMED